MSDTTEKVEKSVAASDIKVSLVNNYDEPGRLRDKKRKRKVKLLSILSFIGCMLLFIVVMAASVGLYIWVDGKMQENLTDVMSMEDEIFQNETGEEPVEQVTMTQTELDSMLAAAKEQAQQDGEKQMLDKLAASINNSASMVQALRPLYEDDLVLVSGGEYYFIPINHELKMHSLKEENLKILDNGFVEYVENGTVVSHKGIDVSKHQGEIDWAQVAADGVEFAFIRVGNRGYGSGAIVDDPQFEANIVGATSNGIKVGVYFFSQAITVEEAKEEAQYVLDRIAPYKISCPVVLDVEKVSDSEARMNKISMEERTANTIAFLEAIEAAGYKTMLYHNMEMGALMLDMTQLENYEKWFAYYNKEIYYPYEFSVWQYSDKGKVNGIKGDVDLNISFHLWDE
ncbi:MAG: glycoside hydrolase family 25 protein [Lachnospiraceae bacterium]|nr:glycoside hydrolase family 25 protein [Lachnospiraceae bacterium]